MHPPRSSSIVGLVWRLLRVRIRLLALGAATALAITTLLLLTIGGSAEQESMDVPRPARVASFNIEFFPKDQRQIGAAFRVIEGVGASALGVQEIIDTTIFAHEAKQQLGDSWRFVFQEVVRPSASRPALHIGVLYDGDVFQLESALSRSETQIDDRTQATFQVQLRERATGERFTMLVLHFKALPEGREQRVQQFDGLRRIVSEQQGLGQSLIVMGDFNATEEADRHDLQTLSEKSGLVWATQELPCSAFWERSQDCPTSRLDHILSWKAPTLAVAEGGCSAGCQRRNSCPLYRHEVSDHCPVVIELSDFTR